MQLNSTLKLNPRLLESDCEKMPIKDGYGAGLLEAGKENSTIVVLTADLSKSTKSDLFQKEFPDRFIQVGVAEQNMAGIAAGLALSGKTPFMASYAVFSPGRNWEQIRVAVCYSNANVKIVSSHSGFTDEGDGATHQALEDIALMRVLPNMTVLVPCDYYEAKKAVKAAVGYSGPVYIRTGREATPVVTTEETQFEIGKAYILKEGSDLTIVACGPLVYEAVKAAKLLSAKEVDCEVINSPTIKPLDEETILKSCKKTGKVVTVEEHQITGGLGSAVSELLSGKMPAPLLRVGVNDAFGESGEYQELLDKFKLSAKSIIIEV